MDSVDNTANFGSRADSKEGVNVGGIVISTKGPECENRKITHRASWSGSMLSATMKTAMANFSGMEISKSPSPSVIEKSGSPYKQTFSTGSFAPIRPVIRRASQPTLSVPGHMGTAPIIRGAALVSEAIPEDSTLMVAKNGLKPIFVPSARRFSGSGEIGVFGSVNSANSSGNTGSSPARRNSGSFSSKGGIYFAEASTNAAAAATARRRSVGSVPLDSIKKEESNVAEYYEIVIKGRTKPLPSDIKPAIPTNYVCAPPLAHGIQNVESNSEMNIEEYTETEIYQFLLISKELAAAAEFLCQLIMNGSQNISQIQIAELRMLMVEVMANKFSSTWNIKNPLEKSENRTIVHQASEDYVNADPILSTVFLMNNIHPSLISQLIKIQFTMTVNPGIVAYESEDAFHSGVVVLFEARPYLPPRNMQPIEHGLEARQRAAAELEIATISGAVEEFDINSYFGGGATKQSNGSAVESQVGRPMSTEFKIDNSKKSYYSMAGYRKSTGRRHSYAYSYNQTSETNVDF